VRSRSEAMSRWAGAIAIALIVAAPRTAVTSQPPAVSGRGDGPTWQEISRALEAVKADPNIAAEKTIKTLQWNRSRQSAEPSRLAWLQWIADFFAWIARGTRLVVWAAAIILAGLLVVYVVRVGRARRLPVRERVFVAPTHVHDLDIRPEALPPDIGAAARRHWDAGEHRTALALLYRGLLSRLVHGHRVPIRDSSTEGDCLTLAYAHLEGRSREYTSQLVNVWQRSVYGREQIEAGLVYALCDGFKPALERGADAVVRRGTA